MQLGQSKGWNRVDRKNQPNQASEIRINVSVEVNPFGVLQASDMIYFESEIEREELEWGVIPAGTPVDEVIHQIGNAVVLG